MRKSQSKSNWNFIMVLTTFAIIIPIIHGSSTPEYLESHIDNSTSKIFRTEQDITRVKEQLDEIITDLKVLHKIFSVATKPSKLRRSLVEQPECAVSKNSLKELKLHVKNTIALALNCTQSCDIYELALKDSENCKDVVGIFLWGMEHMKNRFLEVSGSFIDMETWKIAYELLFYAFQLKEEYLRESLSNDDQSKLDSLKSKFNNLYNFLETVFESFEIHEIETCVGEIIHGNIKSAIEHAQNLKSNSIAKIIKQSFQDSSEKLTSFDLIIRFILKQQKLGRNVAFQNLYNEMLDYCVVEFSTLKSSEHLENTTVNLCLLEIKLGKIQEAVEHFQHLNSTLIVELVQKSYELDNFENLMSFIRKQQDASQRKMALEALAEVMQGDQEDTKMNLCVLKIVLGKTEEAQELYKDLKSIPLGKIVNLVYNLHNDTNDLTNLAYFMQQQNETSFCDGLKASRIIYTNAFKTLKSNQSMDLYGYKLVTTLPIFSRDVRDYKNCIPETQDIWMNIIAYEGDILPFISLQVFQDKNKLNITPEGVDKYMNEIIGPAIFKGIKQENILRDRFDDFFGSAMLFGFADSKSIGFGIQILTAVFDELKNQNFVNNHNQIPKFAFTIKNFMEQIKYQNLDEKYKIEVENIQRKLPPWIRQLIWNGDKCKLKNTHLGEYLYGSDKNYSDYHHVFVGKSEAAIEWKFEIDKKGNFTIMNVLSNEFLTIASEKNNSWFKFVDRRPVFTWMAKDKNQNAWKISSVYGGNDVIIEKNGENLYIEDGDSLNRFGHRVFTSGKSGRTLRSKWELICE